MAITTDFTTWLDEISNEDFVEVFALYRAVSDGSDFGAFKVAPAKGEDNGFIVTWLGSDIEGLHLASDRAKAAFLQSLQNETCKDGEDIESTYAYNHAMMKDD